MRHAAWMLLVGPVLFLGGCVSPGLEPLTAADNGSTVTRQVGQTLTITLPANRTTGYSWFATGDVTGVLSLESEPVYTPDASDRMGAGGSTTWTYRAISPGQAHLRMDYRRLFEEDIAPARRFEATVEVTK